MEDFQSKYSGEQVEELLDQVASGGGITEETDPVFSASPAATITDEKITEWNSKSAQGEKGDKGDTGVGVQSVVQTTTSNADGGSNVVTVTLTDGTTSTFTVKNGSKGSQGDKGDTGETGPQGPQGPKGETGATGADGAQGPKGDKGDKGDTGANGTNGTNGKDGADGKDGATFTPSVDSAGNLSWNNDKGLANPPTVNIKGPKGDKGDAGEGGGSSSGGNGAYVEVNHGTSDTTFTLTSNTFHIWDEVASLTLDLGSETSGVANEFLFQFTSGTTATSLTLPDDIKWANDSAPTIEPNKIYQISILKGLASVLEFKNIGDLIENKLSIISNGMGMSTFTFEYPVASDVTIQYINTFGNNGTSIIENGTQSAETSFDPGNENIVSVVINPSSDNTYIYTT